MLIDNAQLDKGVSFFNSYTPPLRKRLVDRIIIPANGKYYNSASGTLNCWIKCGWLDPKILGRSCALLGVNNAEKRIKKWGDHKIMFISCIPRPYAGAKSSGTLHFLAIDGKRRVAGLSERNLDKLPPLATDGWRMLSFTWQFKDGKMRFILPKKIGEVEILNNIKEKDFINYFI